MTASRDETMSSYRGAVERSLTVHYARKVSDGNYGNEEAAASLSVPVIEGVDAVDAIGQALEMAREAVTAQLKRSDSERVRDAMKSEAEREEERRQQEEQYRKQTEERRQREAQEREIQARFAAECQEAEREYEQRRKEAEERATAEAARTREEYAAKLSAVETEAASAKDTVRVLKGEQALAERTIESAAREREAALWENYQERVRALNERITAAIRQEVDPEAPDYDDTPF